MKELQVCIPNEQRALYLDTDGWASVFATVYNPLGRLAAGSIEILPELGAADDWFQIVAPRHREFRGNEAQQVEVIVSVPPDIPAGQYGFRLVAISEDNPDEEFSESESVTLHWNPLLVRRINAAVVSILSLVAIVGILAISGVIYMVANREVRPQETLRTANSAAAAGEWDEYWECWTDEGRDELLVRVAGLLAESLNKKEQENSLRGWIRSYGVAPQDLHGVGRHSMAGDTSIMATAELLKQRFKEVDRTEKQFFVGAARWLEDARESDSVDSHTRDEFRSEFQYELDEAVEIDDSLAQQVGLWNGRQNAASANQTAEHSAVRVMFHKTGRHWLVHDIYPEELTRRTVWELLHGRNEPAEHDIVKIETTRRPASRPGEHEFEEDVDLHVETEPDKAADGHSHDAESTTSRQSAQFVRSGDNTLVLQRSKHEQSVKIATPFLELGESVSSSDNRETADGEVFIQSGATLTVGTFQYREWNDVAAILKRDPFRHRILLLHGDKVFGTGEIDRETGRGTYIHAVSLVTFPTAEPDVANVPRTSADLEFAEENLELMKRQFAHSHTEYSVAGKQSQTGSPNKIQKALTKAKSAALQWHVVRAKDVMDAARNSRQEAEENAKKNPDDALVEAVLQKAKKDVKLKEEAHNRAAALLKTLDGSSGNEEAASFNEAPAEASSSSQFSPDTGQPGVEASRVAFEILGFTGEDSQPLDSATELELYDHDAAESDSAETSTFMIIHLDAKDPLDLQTGGKSIKPISKFERDLAREIQLVVESVISPDDALAGAGSAEAGAASGTARSQTARGASPTPTDVTELQSTKGQTRSANAEAAIRRKLDRRGFDYFINYMYKPNGRWFDWGWEFRNGRRRLRITLNRFGWEFRPGESSEMWGARSVAFRQDTEAVRVAVGDDKGNILLNSKVRFDLPQNTWRWSGTKQELASLRAGLDASLEKVGLAGTGNFQLTPRPVVYSGTSTVMPYNKLEFALSDQRSAAERAFGSVAISPDGEWLAGGDSRGRLRIWRRGGGGQWNLAQESRLGEFLKSFYPQIRLQMRSVAFSADNSRIAVAVTVMFQAEKEGEDETLPSMGYVMVLHRYSKALPYFLVPRLEVQGTAPLSVAFSRDPNSSYLAAGLANGKTRRWRWNQSSFTYGSTQDIDLMSIDTSPVLSLAFGPPDKSDWLAVGQASGTLRLGRCPTSGTWQEFFARRSARGDEEAVRGIAFSPRGALLVGVSDSGLRMWHLDDLKIETN